MKNETATNGFGWNEPALNHNETVGADDEAETDSLQTAPLADLPVADAQAEETKGGLLLPAVQKVREAAAR